MADWNGSTVDSTAHFLAGRVSTRFTASLSRGADTCALERAWLRAKDELALKTARFETAVCLSDLIEADPLSDTWLDGVLASD